MASGKRKVIKRKHQSKETSTTNEAEHFEQQELPGRDVSREGEAIEDKYYYLRAIENKNLWKKIVKVDPMILGAITQEDMTMAEEEEDSDWSLCDYESLPDWMKDNDCLFTGHRPQLVSYYACFRSIFRIHTETVNIWTHMIGCVLFMALFAIFLCQSVPLQEKLVFAPFFIGAILCMGFSFTFHTLSCHSQPVVRLFSRLDYCGISLLIIGSFVPWLYYAFYCYFWPKVVYYSVVLVLGLCSIVVSLSESFSEPTYRPLRAAVFSAFGLSGVVPGLHCALIEGMYTFLANGYPLLVTALLYILGAALYACRIPERLYPGRCDLIFQSHQFFHVLVVLATFINYYGLLSVAHYQRTSQLFCIQ